MCSRFGLSSVLLLPHLRAYFIQTEQFCLFHPNRAVFFFEQNIAGIMMPKMGIMFSLWQAYSKKWLALFTSKTCNLSVESFSKGN